MRHRPQATNGRLNASAKRKIKALAKNRIAESSAGWAWHGSSSLASGPQGQPAIVADPQRDIGDPAAIEVDAGRIRAASKRIQ